jgi:hypothetical protein
MIRNFITLVKHQHTVGASIEDAWYVLRTTHPYVTIPMIRFWYGRFDEENTKT